MLGHCHASVRRRPLHPNLEVGCSRWEENFLALVVSKSTVTIRLNRSLESPAFTRTRSGGGKRQGCGQLTIVGRSYFTEMSCIAFSTSSGSGLVGRVHRPHALLQVSC